MQFSPTAVTSSVFRPKKDKARGVVRNFHNEDLQNIEAMNASRKLTNI
jgi:hypothetical protein